MTLRNNHDWLKQFQPGQKITAEFLTRVSNAINANTRAINAPKQRTNLDDVIKGGGGGGSLGSEVFTSSSITEETVVSTDSNGDTANLERTTQIIFDEDTTGRQITLNIVWPP